MEPLKAFYFNEISSRSFRLVIESKNILGSPEPDLQEYQVPGRDGSVFISNKRRKNVEVSYDTFLRVSHMEDLQPYVTGIKGWLLADPGAYFRLEDDYDLAHYRMATYLSGIEFDNAWRWAARQTLTFSCLPYRYLKTGEQPVAAESGTVSVYNPTAFEALPKLGFALGFQFSGAPSPSRRRHPPANTPGHCGASPPSTRGSRWWWTAAAKPWGCFRRISR